MNTLSATTSILTHSLAWALLYSLWQGILIYSTLFVLLKALPNAGARVKYSMSYISFSVLFLWFAATWYAQYQQLKETIVYIAQVGTNTIMPTITHVQASATTQVHKPLLSNFLPAIDPYFPLIITIYTAGLAFMLLRFLVNIVQLRSLKTQGISQPGQEWISLLQQWQKQLAITKQVRLFLSTRINIPIMLGTLKPVILLPVATINHLTTEQVEAILLHELAHIKRHDYLLNIIQTIVETILFFNPFVWLISAIIRREREHCCDDMVVARAASPLPYAKALAILEDKRINTNGFALAATGNKNQLFRRIKRIMEMKRSRLNYSQLTIIISAILAITITISVLAFTPSFAQKAKNGKSNTNPNNTANEYKPVTIDSNGNNTIKEKASSAQLKDDSNVTKNEETKTPPAIEEYKPTYSEDTAIIRFMMKNGTNVWARLADDPLGAKGIIREISYNNEGNPIDWNELKYDLQYLINNAYKSINNSLLSKKIETDINQTVDRQKKFREEYVSIIDSIYISFEMKDGSKYYVNLFSNPLLTHKIFKGIRSVINGKYTDWNELRSNLEHSVNEAYKNINSPQLQQEIETQIDEEIAQAKIRETESETMHSAQNAFLNEMEKDGLIDTAAGYKISYDTGTLYINGIKQPQNIVDKYCGQLDKRRALWITNIPPGTSHH